MMLGGVIPAVGGDEGLRDSTRLFIRPLSRYYGMKCTVPVDHLSPYNLWFIIGDNKHYVYEYKGVFEQTTSRSEVLSSISISGVLQLLPFFYWYTTR